MGRPGPPANESRASRSPDPRKGPGERGAGRRRRPGSEGRSPSPRRARSSAPRRASTNSRTGSEGRSSGPQPGGPEPGGGRKGPKGPARGPRPARTTERRGEKRRPRRGVREGGDDGREQTRPRERDARAEAKKGKGGRSRSRPGTPGGDPQPASAYRAMAAADPRKARPGPTECRPRKIGRPREGHPQRSYAVGVDLVLM